MTIENYIPDRLQQGAVVVLLFVCLFIPLQGNAEGVKDLRPQIYDVAALYIGNQAGLYTNFGKYGAPDSRQIKIRIADTSEVIHYGLHARLPTGINGTLSDIPYRILDPNGNVVFTSQVPDNNGPGYIVNYNEAVTGPQALVNTGGYNSRTFHPSQTGDYVIEFDQEAVGNEFILHLWDITVENSNGNAVEGRVHSGSWQVTVRYFDISFEGNLYPYDSTNNVLYEVDFNGMEPYLFVVNFNATGTASTGNFTVDRQSVVGNETYPQYTVFLNPVDTSLYPTGDAGITFTGTKQMVSCNNSSYCLSFTSKQSGALSGYIDVNNDSIFNAADGDVRFNKKFNGAATNCVFWDGTDSHGNPVNSTDVRVFYQFGHGAMHLPLYDVEDHQAGFNVTIESPSNKQDPDLYWDDRNISEGTALDGLINLQGCDLDLAGGCHRWINRGQQNGQTSYQQTINTWWYSEVKHDTIDFKKDPQKPVALSYDPDSLINYDSTVCRGAYVDLFVYTGDSTHYDTSKYSYEWILNGSKVGNDTSEQRFEVTGNATVTLRAEYRKDTTCFTMDTIELLDEPPVEVTSQVINDTCSQYGSIDVTVKQSPPDSVFTWQKFPDSTSSLSHVRAGTYYLNITSPGFEGHCALDTSFTIEERTIIDIDTLLNKPSACFNPTGWGRVEMTPPSRDYSYVWSGAGGDYKNSDEADSLLPGSHMVVIEDDTTGCVEDTTFEVGVTKPDYEVESSPEYCGKANGSIQVNAGPLAEIVWQDSSSLDGLGRSGLSAGNYSFTLTNPYAPNVCHAGTTVAIVNDTALLDAGFTYRTAGPNDDLHIDDLVHFNNQSSGDIDSSHWNFGDGMTSGKYNPSHSYSDSGMYAVRLEVFSPGGCRDYARKSLHVLPDIPCNMAIPTAFSPNGDGENEKIGVLGNVENIQFTIFNRWGEPVFRTNDPDKRWDGTYRGQEAPVGVYTFVLHYTCPEDNQWRRHTGQITLVK